MGPDGGGKSGREGTLQGPTGAIGPPPSTLLCLEEEEEEEEEEVEGQQVCRAGELCKGGARSPLGKATRPLSERGGASWLGRDTEAEATGQKGWQHSDSDPFHFVKKRKARGRLRSFTHREKALLLSPC